MDLKRRPGSATRTFLVSSGGGVFINLIIPTHLLDPKALGKNDLVALDDGDGHAGHLPVLLGLLGVMLEVGQNLFELLGVRLFCRFGLGRTGKTTPAVRKTRRVNTMKNPAARWRAFPEKWAMDLSSLVIKCESWF